MTKLIVDLPCFGTSYQQKAIRIQGLGTSEFLSLAKCKWWIAALFWDEKGREKMGWPRSPYVLEVVRYPWPMAICFEWFTWLKDLLKRMLHRLNCIVLFCSLGYSDPKILKVSQSCYLYQPSGTSPSDKSAAVGDFELMKYQIGCLCTCRSCFRQSLPRPFDVSTSDGIDYWLCAQTSGGCPRAVSTTFALRRNVTHDINSTVYRMALWV